MNPWVVGQPRKEWPMLEPKGARFDLDRWPVAKRDLSPIYLKELIPVSSMEVKRGVGDDGTKAP